MSLNAVCHHCIHASPPATIIAHVAQEAAAAHMVAGWQVTMSPPRAVPTAAINPQGMFGNVGGEAGAREDAWLQGAVEETGKRVQLVIGWNARKTLMVSWGVVWL